MSDVDSNATALPPLMSTSLSVSSLSSSSSNYRPALIHCRHPHHCHDKGINNNPPWSLSEDNDEDEVAISTMLPRPCRHCKNARCSVIVPSVVCRPCPPLLQGCICRPPPSIPPPPTLPMSHPPLPYCGSPPSARYLTSAASITRGPPPFSL